MAGSIDKRLEPPDVAEREHLGNGRRPPPRAASEGHGSPGRDCSDREHLGPIRAVRVNGRRIVPLIRSPSSDSELYTSSASSEDVPARSPPRYIERHVRAARTVQGVMNMVMDVVADLVSLPTLGEMHEAEALCPPSCSGAIAQNREAARALPAVHSLHERLGALLNLSETPAATSPPPAWNPPEEEELCPVSPPRLSPIVPPDYPAGIDSVGCPATDTYPWKAEFLPFLLDMPRSVLKQATALQRLRAAFDHERSVLLAWIERQDGDIHLERSAQGVILLAQERARRAHQLCFEIQTWSEALSQQLLLASQGFRERNWDTASFDHPLEPAEEAGGGGVLRQCLNTYLVFMGCTYKINLAYVVPPKERGLLELYLKDSLAQLAQLSRESAAAPLTVEEVPDLYLLLHPAPHQRVLPAASPLTDGTDRYYAALASGQGLAPRSKGPREPTVANKVPGHSASSRVCPECGATIKTCNFQRHLDRHMRGAPGQSTSKPMRPPPGGSDDLFRCPACPYMCATMLQLHPHWTKKHEGKLPRDQVRHALSGAHPPPSAHRSSVPATVQDFAEALRCPACPYTCISMHQLRPHWRQKHKGPLPKDRVRRITSAPAAAVADPPGTRPPGSLQDSGQQPGRTEEGRHGRSRRPGLKPREAQLSMMCRQCGYHSSQTYLLRRHLQRKHGLCGSELDSTIAAAEHAAHASLVEKKAGPAAAPSMVPEPGDDSEAEQVEHLTALPPPQATPDGVISRSPAARPATLPHPASSSAQMTSTLSVVDDAAVQAVGATAGCHSALVVRPSAEPSPAETVDLAPVAKPPRDQRITSNAPREKTRAAVLASSRTSVSESVLERPDTAPRDQEQTPVAIDGSSAADGHGVSDKPSIQVPQAGPHPADHPLPEASSSTHLRFSVAATSPDEAPPQIPQPAAAPSLGVFPPRAGAQLPADAAPPSERPTRMTARQQTAAPPSESSETSHSSRRRRRTKAGKLTEQRQPRKTIRSLRPQSEKVLPPFEAEQAGHTVPPFEYRASVPDAEHMSRSTSADEVERTALSPTTATVPLDPLEGATQRPSLSSDNNPLSILPVPRRSSRSRVESKVEDRSEAPPSTRSRVTRLGPPSSSAASVKEREARPSASSTGRATRLAASVGRETRSATSAAGVESSSVAPSVGRETRSSVTATGKVSRTSRLAAGKEAVPNAPPAVHATRSSDKGKEAIAKAGASTKRARSSSVVKDGSKGKRRKTGQSSGDQSASEAATPGDPETFCYCGGPSFGKMVGCDNDDCPRQWYHVLCVGLRNAEDVDPWYCNFCAPPDWKEHRGRKVPPNAKFVPPPRA